MLCEICGKNNATTHIRSVVNGIVKEMNLCGYCAAKEGYHDLAHNSLAEMLASMFGDALSSGSAITARRCNCCGATFSDIAEKGRVGCSECYTTFYDDLLPYLKRVHGAIEHSGKRPNKAQLTVTRDEESIEALRDKLNLLVREERFEEAAVIRDKIKKLEQEDGE